MRTLLFLLTVTLPCSPCAHAADIMLGHHDLPWVRVSAPTLGDSFPEVNQTRLGEHWNRVEVTWELAETVVVPQVAVTLDLQFTPDFWWAPHLAPEQGDVIAQHVFRSPALIAAQAEKHFVVVPDLDLCGNNPDTPWFLDFDAPARRMQVGLAKTTVADHVRYRLDGEIALGPGTLTLAFFTTVYDDHARPANPWHRVSRFLWQRYGKPLYTKGEPLDVPMDRYVDHTYRWAFDTWADAVWQEFEIDGAHVGAPAFIVNVTQSPNFPGPVDMREFLSVWNQAWFSTLRAMSGAMRYAMRTEDADLKRRALLAKQFALAAPLREGLFPTVYATEMEHVEVDGKRVNRSKGWETGHWTNSNRCPRNYGVTPAWYHVLDMSWTALLMLRWHEELEQDPALVAYARTYADSLLTLQDDRGFFPAWLHPDTLEPAAILRESPETSMSVTFLLKLAEVTGETRYREAALHAMDAVLVEVVPAGRWEDFETYWSCNGFWNDQVGTRIPRNAMYKQNNFSMFWTAEALLAAYHVTGDARYLAWGRRTLDELGMCQQVWQPPFIYIPALGGFGVMNFDGEWNDSRQCLFAELFMDYYRVTGEREYFERGIAALKSAFVMMYCPENPEVKQLWERVWPFFGEEDYGFTMENYGHGGTTSPEGMGMGEFTIFTWGNGAAAEARNRIHDHYGDVYVDRVRGEAFGIDSVEASLDGQELTLRDRAGGPRKVRLVFEDGHSRTLKLDGTVTVALE